jgi:hypothetical protein
MESNNKDYPPTNGEQTMTKIEQEIKKATKFNGFYAGAYMLEDAYHACNPENPYHWQGRAVQFDGNLAKIGYVDWNFCSYEGAEEIEDSDMLPWDDESLCDFRVESEYNLNNPDDLDDFMSEITGWI